MFCNRYCIVFDFVVFFDDICDILRMILICCKVFFLNFFIFVFKVVRISGLIVVAVLTDVRVDDKIIFCIFFVMVNCFRWNLLILFFIIFFIEMFEVVLLGLGCVVVDVLDFVMDFLSFVLSFFLI